MTPTTGKRGLEQRWRDLQLDAYQGFRHSSDCARLKQVGLRLLGRSAQLTAKELFVLVSTGDHRKADWLEFIAQCREVGARYGLAARTVMKGSLVKGYRPEDDKAFDPAAVRARVVIVTDLDADLGSPFFRNLLIRAAELGLTVQAKSGRFPPSRGGFVMRGGSVCAIPWWDYVELSDEQRPALSTAFRVRLELPPRFPPELACALARQAVQAQNELARLLGYRVPQRLRRPSVARRE